MKNRSKCRLVRQLADSVQWSKSSRLRFTCAFLLICVLAVAAPSFCAEPSRPVKVLMLYYGDKNAPALAEFQNGLRTKMEQELHAPVFIYDETLDEAWTGHRSTYERATEAFLREKYTKRGIDVVVPVGDYPMQFMQARRKKLLPGAKFVYFCLGRSPRQPIPDATGLVLQIDLVPTIEIALSQNPGTRHVLLIAGATPVDRAWVQMVLPGAMKYLQDRHKTVDVQVLPSGTFADSQRTLAALPQDTVTVIVGYHGDSEGQGFVTARIVPTLSAITNRPMYGWADIYLGRGIVGGNLLNFQANGAVLGSLVLRVVRGEEPGTIPEIATGLSQNMFDWRQMKRWGIAMSSMPPDSTVLNREFTFWELYKWRIIGLLGLIVIEALLIAWLFKLVTSQKRHLKELAYRREMAALIAQSAAAFINLPPELVSKEIESVFQRVLEFCDLDRIGLFEHSPETSQLRLLSSRGSTNAGQPLAVIDLRQLPLTAAQMLRGTPILASSLEELPPEASTLREALRANGVRSFAAFPLLDNQRTFGTLAFSTVRRERVWEPDNVRALQTIADILGNALKMKHAEETARESSNRLTGIVESAMDAVIAIDDRQRIVVFNATAEKMFGCPADDALGQPIERFIPQRFRARHGEHIYRFSETGDTNRAMGSLGALWALRANGEEFPIEASISQVKVGESKLFTAIVRDVTQREEAERQLRKSHDLNLSILQSLRNHLAVLDSEGTIVAATSRGPDFVAVSGINVLDLRVGANYLDMCRVAVEAGDRDVGAALQGVQSVYSGRQKYFELEYDYKSGIDQRWFLMSVTPLKTPGGGVVISHEDITERKRHEKAIQELSGRLINAQEQERSRIARELHDDINQQVAMLAIELQQLEGSLPEALREGRQKVQAMWEKTHLLSTEIQHLSHRLHSAKLEHLGITAALRGLCDEFSAQHGVEASCQFRQIPPRVDSDISLALFRVAQESLHNVAKHSHAKRVRLELFGEDEQIVLRVSDDGIGFDPDAHRDITGLGMLSMNERIRLVGGALSVTSRPSLGTQVEATVPLSSSALSANRTPESVALGRK